MGENFQFNRFSFYMKLYYPNMYDVYVYREVV